MATAKKPPKNTKASPKATQKAVKPDWQAIELQFVNGSMNLEDLATKHGIKPVTMRQRASRGKWQDKRNDLSRQVTQAAQAKIAKTRTEELEKLDRNAVKIANGLQTLAARGIQAFSNGEELVYKPSDLKLLASVGEIGHKMGRLACGATTENTGLSAPDGGSVKADMTVSQFHDLARQVAADV